MSIDISDQTSTEEKLRQQMRLLTLLNEMSRDAIRNRSMQELLPVLASRMAELSRADCTYIAIWDARQEQPSIVASCNPSLSDHTDASPEPAIFQAIDWVVHERRILVMDDTQPSEDFAPKSNTQATTGTLLGVPLFSDGEILGAALVHYRSARHFTRDEITYGEQAGHQIALAIAKTQLMDELELRVDERTAQLEEITCELREEIEQRNRMRRMQAVLYEISEAAQTSLNLDQLFQSIHTVVARAMPAANFYIALYDPDTDSFAFPYFVDAVDETPAKRKSRRGVTEYVFRKQTLLHANQHVLAELAASGEIDIDGRLPMEWLGAPLRTDSRTIGVLAVQSYDENVQFSADDRQVLSFISEQIALVIERKQAEEALQEARDRLQTVLTLIPTGIMLIDAKTHRIVQVNQAAAKLVGEPAEQIIGTACYTYMCPQGPDECPVSDLGKHSDNSQRVIFTANGHSTPVLKTVVSIVLGGCRYLLVSLTDLTEFKQLENQAQASKKRSDTLFDAASDAIFVYDLNGRILEVNRTASERLGYSREELLAKTRLSINAVQYATTIITQLTELPRLGHVVFETEHVRRDGSTLPVEVASRLVDFGGETVVLTIARDISRRKKEEEKALRLAIAVERTVDAVVITDHVGIIQYVNPAFEKITGYASDEAIGQNIDILSGRLSDEAAIQDSRETLRSGKMWSGSLIQHRKDGTPYEEDVSVAPIRNAQGQIVSYVSVRRDVTELRRLEAQVRQTQKLEAIGRLAAGIAHEINTPTQYVGNNLRFLDEGFSELLALLQLCIEAFGVTRTEELNSDLIARIITAMAESDIDYLIEEIPMAIRGSLNGIDSVASIVKAMKNFSHPGASEKTLININQAIDNAITVARNEWKYCATMDTNFDDALPPIPCLVGEFNQVMLNLLTNAAQAITQKLGESAHEKGAITVSTRYDGDWVEISVADTGAGIPEDIRERVFEPFFTTKEVGKGTGQGLMISHDVIVNKLGGYITFETEVGQGTTFIIRLPTHADRATATESRLIP